MDFDDELMPDMLPGQLPSQLPPLPGLVGEAVPPPPPPVYNLQPPIGMPVSTPASVPQAFPPQQQLRPAPAPTNSKGPDLLFRVQMGFRSRVKTEEYWSLSTLLAFSTARNFDLLKSRPDLIELVVDFVRREWDAVVVDRRDYAVLVARQKVLEALLIVRNMCLDAHLAKQLSRGCEAFVAKGVALPADPAFAEMRLLCLEICEHTCFHFAAPDAALFRDLVGLIASRDKSVVVAAVRSVARLSLCDVRDASPLFSYPDALQRVARLLLIDDAELLAALLDLLVQLTSRAQRVEQLQPLGDAEHLVQHLVRLLAFRMDLQPLAYPRLARRTQRPVPAVPPELSPQILGELLAMNEPERATMWIRSSYDTDPDGEVLQVSLWSNYQKLFEPHERDGTGRRLLKAIDFIRACTSNVRGAQAKVIAPDAGPKKFIIKGLVPREKAVAPSQLLAEAQPGDARGRPPPPYTDAVVKVLQNIAALQGGPQLLRPHVLRCVENALVNPQAFEGLAPLLDVV